MLTRLKSLARATDGLAAVEFALIAPVMILLFYGAVELSSAIDCNSRVARMSSTAADLVAQSTAVASSDVTNVFSAATAILFPYSATPAKIVLTSAVDDGNGGAKVAWSQATSNASARTTNDPVPVPAGLIAKGSGASVIVAEVSYAYTPPVTFFLASTITLSSTFYSKPRRSLTVTHS